MKYVVDGNAFLNVAINVVAGILTKGKRTDMDVCYVQDLYDETKTVLTESAKAEFRSFSIKYFNSIISPIGHMIDEVHFVFDSKSWRGEYIDAFFKKTEPSASRPPEFNYKGTRKADDRKFLFFEYFQKDILVKLNDKCGINQHRVYNCEGDDLISYIFENTEDNMLIYTVDMDLKQLVDGDKRYSMLVMPKQMSRAKKLFTPTNVSINESVSDDFFSLEDSGISDSSSPDRIINEYITKGYVEYKVDSSEELLTKIIGGDKSDHIPRLNKMTKAKVEKLVKATLEEYGTDIKPLLDKLDSDFIEFMLNHVLTLTKTNESELDALREHLILNIRLIRLSTEVLPDDVKENMDKHFDSIQETHKFSYEKFLDIKNNPILIS